MLPRNASDAGLTPNGGGTRRGQQDRLRARAGGRRLAVTSLSRCRRRVVGVSGARTSAFGETQTNSLNSLQPPAPRPVAHDRRPLRRVQTFERASRCREHFRLQRVALGRERRAARPEPLGYPARASSPPAGIATRRHDAKLLAKRRPSRAMAVEERYIAAAAVARNRREERRAVDSAGPARRTAARARGMVPFRSDAW